MIYVYVNGKRMAFLQKKLKAKTLQNTDVLQERDTIVLPVLKKDCKQLPLSKGFLSLSSLHNLNVYLPFEHPLIPNDNTFYYYMKEEKVVLENAYLTALGILLYISQHHFSLYDAKIDIIGQGRCGSALISLLELLHVNYQVIHHGEDMKNYLLQKKGNIIVNTAPVCYLDVTCLKEEDTKLILDISSEQCCVRKLKDSSIDVVYPGSLPDMYFACSSADLIYEFIRREKNEK